MITIGVTGWGDHDELYIGAPKSKHRLSLYSEHFQVVELDSSFYHIPSENQINRWISETPQNFQFVVKAYSAMTLHKKEIEPYKTRAEMFTIFAERMKLLQEAGKLAMVLFQFSPRFRCTKESVQYINYCKQSMKDFPLAIEFRNRTWYEPYRESTISYIKNEGWIHTVVDQPQAGESSCGIELFVTNREKTLIRFHGRNVVGWNHNGQSNWREVRFLYRYNKQELLEWKQRIEMLSKQTEQLYILFNNNSGGDAATNAKELMELLGLSTPKEITRQMSLFDHDK